jgi:glyoxylase-like metal-dependent hydrolase (beta-lactamase superfamily II)
VRAVGVHADVIVVTSAIWATTCTAIRGGPEEAFVVDSPVLPEELEALPRLLEQAGFAVVGLLATHADWDHVLARAAFPEAPLGVSESTARRLQASPGETQRELREFDDRHYIERPPLGLGGLQELPVPGHCEVGKRELELHPAEGHTSDGTAVVAPWAGVLCCGDYVSPVEIPMLWTGADLDAYRETLERLRGLVERAPTVVPGHGGPLTREQALEVLEQDDAYLEALERDGEGAALPRLQRSPEQRRVHAANVRRLRERS